MSELAPRVLGTAQMGSNATHCSAHADQDGSLAAFLTPDLTRSPLLGVPGRAHVDEINFDAGQPNRKMINRRLSSQSY